MKRFSRFISYLILLLALMLPLAARAGGAQGIPCAKVSGGVDTDMVINSQIRVIAQPYLTAIAEGNIPNHTMLSLDGKNSDVDTFAGSGEQIIWMVPHGTQAQYVYPSVAATVDVTSDDSDDTAAGTGARAVTITGLDTNLALVTDIVATSGTTISSSTVEFLRVNDVEVTSAGTGGKNAGNISVKNGANILSYIEEGTNKSIQLVYTVPADMEFYVARGTGTGAGTKNVEIHIYAREPDGLFRQLKHRTINDSPFSLTVFKLTAGTDIEGRAHSDVTGGKCDLSLEGWLEDSN
jgi:hypothetical protein